MELHPLVPIRLASLARSGHGARLFAELAHRFLPVVGRRAPAVAVDPDSVHAILAGQFAKLRDQQHVDIGAEYRCRPAVGLAIRLDGRPRRMSGHGMIIPNARIMHEQGDSPLARHLAPDPQRIADEARGRLAHFGRIARITAMPFAIDLEVVGLDLVDHGLDHLRRGPRPNAVAIVARMEVEMDAEKSLGPCHPRCLGRERHHRQQAREDRAENGRQERPHLAGTHERSVNAHVGDSS